MYTLFISDLHLDPSRPELTAIFFMLLEQQARQADALYILGDFFEVWVGDDGMADFEQSVIRRLKSLAQTGVKIYLMHGNRDFLLGQRFCQQAGCHLLSDPTVINLYGVPAVLTHGDLLCTEDIAYQRFRRLARNSFIQKLFLLLPLSVRQKIARYLRGQSHTPDHGIAVDAWADATANGIEKMLRENKAELLIHGHTHRPSIELKIEAQATKKRVVLSDWETQGNALVYYADHSYRLVHFNQDLNNLTLCDR